MFFLRQMRQVASSFSTSTATYGSYHGRSLNSFSNRSLTPYFLVCSTIGGYFGMKINTVADKYLSLVDQKDKIIDSERASPHKP